MIGHKCLNALYTENKDLYNTTFFTYYKGEWIYNNSLLL